MSNGVEVLSGVPGTVVPSGALITPGGQQGPGGQPAYTVNTAAFTVPAAGSTVVINVNNASWAAQGEWVYVAGADGAGGAAVLQITNISGNQLTLLNPGPGTITPPLASVTGAGLLSQISGRTTDYVGGDNLCHPLSMVSGFIAKSAAYSVLPADSGKYFLCTGTGWTLTLPMAAAGLYYYIRNDQGLIAAGTITIAAQGGQTIDGATSINLLPGQDCTIITDGSNYRTFGLKREVIVGTIDGAGGQTVLLPSGYRIFELEFTGIQTTGGGDQWIWFQVSSNGGTTWIAANYYNGFLYNTSGTAAAYLNQNNQTRSYLVPMTANTAQQYAMAKLILYPGKTGENPNWLTDCGYWYVGGAITQKYNIWGFLDQQVLLNALQYYPNAGSITNMHVTVKGKV